MKWLIQFIEQNKLFIQGDIREWRCKGMKGMKVNYSLHVHKWSAMFCQRSWGNTICQRSWGDQEERGREGGVAAMFISGRLGDGNGMSLHWNVRRRWERWWRSSIWKDNLCYCKLTKDNKNSPKNFKYNRSEVFPK